MAVIAIDFDQTLVNGDVPIAGAKEAINLLRERKHSIVIYSCNNKAWIKRVLDDNDIRYDWIFDRLDFMQEGKPIADWYIDDRAVRFEGDWCKTLDTLRDLGLPQNGL